MMEKPPRANFQWPPFARDQVDSVYTTLVLRMPDGRHEISLKPALLFQDVEDLTVHHFLCETCGQEIGYSFGAGVPWRDESSQHPEPIMLELAVWSRKGSLQNALGSDNSAHQV